MQVSFYSLSPTRCTCVGFSRSVMHMRHAHCLTRVTNQVTTNWNKIRGAGRYAQLLNLHVTIKPFQACIQLAVNMHMHTLTPVGGVVGQHQRLSWPLLGTLMRLFVNLRCCAQSPILILTSWNKPKPTAYLRPKGCMSNISRATGVPPPRNACLPWPMMLTFPLERYLPFPKIGKQCFRRSNQCRPHVNIPTWNVYLCRSSLIDAYPH